MAALRSTATVTKTRDAACFFLALTALSCGDDLGPLDGGPAAAQVSWLDAYVTGEEIVRVPRDLSTSTVVAHALVDGTWLAAPGAGSKDGVITIEDAPADQIQLQVDDVYWDVDITGQPQVGFRIGGRPDVVYPGGVTQLDLSVTGLDPWQTKDELFLFAPGAGFTVGLAHTGFTVIPDAATSVDSFPANYVDLPLVQQSQGDRSWLVQLRYRTTPSASVQQALGAAEVSMEQVAGEVLPVTVALSDGGAGALAIDTTLDSPALAAAVAPVTDAQAVSPAFALFARATVDGQVAASPSATLYAYTPVALDAPASIQAEVPDPFPDSWLRYFYGVSFLRPLSAHGADPDGLGGFVGVEANAPVPADTELPELPAVNVDGIDALGAGGVTAATPSIEWTAGDGGSFVVELFSVIDAANVTFFDRRAVFYTSNHHIDIPPGLLGSGDLYALRVWHLASRDGIQTRAITPSSVFEVE